MNYSDTVKYNFILIVVSVAVLLSLMPTTSAAQALPIGTFEQGGLIDLNPNEEIRHRRYLWHEVERDRKGVSSVTADAARTGALGLKSVVEYDNSQNSSSQTHFYPNLKNNGVNNIKYMHDYISPNNWQYDHYNRIRFWILMPPQVQKARTGQTNLHFGTYIRRTTASSRSSESDNGHFYHYFNLPQTGVWHQVIVDWHPTHQRGGRGANEEGEWRHPFGQTARNYFDLLTRFYVQIRKDADSFPITIKYDDFEVYHDPNNESVEQIYSLHGAYRPSDNRVFIGWNRLKNQNGGVHEVRYAYNDIHQIGWSSAKLAPGGRVQVGKPSGYNRLEYESNQINFSGRNFVYFAIKPEGSSTFRQIIIPRNPRAVLPNSSAPPPPRPPSDTTPSIVPVINLLMDDSCDGSPCDG